MRAGVAAYIEHMGGNPDDVVTAIWCALSAERQREAMDLYWDMYD